ncbi:hypothetical protein AM228_13690 [Planktothricoides sp. SR001]|nr:hypothetical protein AM228_13690 [Planktothricoides sp. SR001]
MNTKLFATAAAATTATALLGFAGAAQAFSFGNNGMSFGQDTGVKFNFIQSNNWFKSTVSVYEVTKDAKGKLQTTLVADLFKEVKNSDNGSKNGFLGTIEGGAVQVVNTTVTFLANKVYALGLTSANPDGTGTARTVFTMNALNIGGGQRAVFEAPHSQAKNGNDGAALLNPGGYSVADPFQPHPTDPNRFKPVSIGFEDIYWNAGDADYNDFIVTAEAPEPLTIGGLVLGGAGLLAARRRRQGKQA